MLLPPERPNGLLKGTSPLILSYSTGVARIDVESDGMGVSERGREETTMAEMGSRVYNRTLALGNKRIASTSSG